MQTIYAARQTALAPTVARNRYAGALEQAPELLATLKAQSENEFDLTSEITLARTLLENLVQQVGASHARAGNINPLALDGVSRMISQVQSIVSTAACIQAKRDDQRISAGAILALLVALRDDLKRRMNMAFGENAALIVEEVFKNARWTGGLKEEDVREALLAPAAFDLQLSVVDREGDAIKVAAKAHSMTSPELLALSGVDADVDKLDPLAVPEDDAQDANQEAQPA